MSSSTRPEAMNISTSYELRYRNCGADYHSDGQAYPWPSANASQSWTSHHPNSLASISARRYTMRELNPEDDAVGVGSFAEAVREEDRLFHETFPNAKYSQQSIGIVPVSLEHSEAVQLANNDSFLSPTPHTYDRLGAILPDLPMSTYVETGQQAQISSPWLYNNREGIWSSVMHDSDHAMSSMETSLYFNGGVAQETSSPSQHFAGRSSDQDSSVYESVMGGLHDDSAPQYKAFSSARSTFSDGTLTFGSPAAPVDAAANDSPTVGSLSPFYNELSAVSKNEDDHHPKISSCSSSATHAASGQSRKKPPLACLFCRGRKIACGPPEPGSEDASCNQCKRRSLKCVFPTESRRGARNRKTESDDDSSAPPKSPRKPGRPRVKKTASTA